MTTSEKENQHYNNIFSFPGKKYKPKRDRKTRKKKGGKLSLKYKRSIDCKHPKGFSQKQHCKYGKSRHGRTRR